LSRQFQGLILRQQKTQGLIRNKIIIVRKTNRQRGRLFVKVLLAGPGTGKTARVRSIVDKDFADAERVLILSFTNATVQDLTASFSGYPGVECQTLHSYALKINHLKDHYILDAKQEAPILEKLADSPDGDLGFLCAQLKCISFDAMIAECLRFLKTNPVYGSEQIGELDLLIVDEYQDFNATERTLVEAISEFAAEIIILGDDDQSIYGFKDADPDGIIELYGRDGIERIDHEHICFRCPRISSNRSRGTPITTFPNMVINRR